MIKSGIRILAGDVSLSLRKIGSRYDTISIMFLQFHAPFFKPQNHFPKSFIEPRGINKEIQVKIDKLPSIFLTVFIYYVISTLDML